ncbi:hypothetical protein DSO57_1030738 [Entomophthora muscae]|uniref:Uncharacterized protein n=1 Tax=Entomophthora muscae TaxID=34485 RepID=A0ACC2S2W8_9FUNG|nr:hypothetical protein DSO57_1030738 [Entomophthora muscae]
MQTTGGSLILTPNQNLLLSAIPTQHQKEIQALLLKHQLPSDPERFTKIRLSSMACVALPTCTLAMAEAERYLPALITKIEDILLDLQLDQTDISLRMTGCPNGCARPYVSEIALVGKAPGTYNLLLGGDLKGTRLNTLYRESLTEPEILQTLAPLLANFKSNRLPDEPFGDFLYRTDVIQLPPKRPSPMPGFASNYAAPIPAK